MRDQDTHPSSFQSLFTVSQSLHQATIGSTKDGVVINKVAHSLGGFTGQSPSHSLPHQQKEGLSFPPACGELIKPEADSTGERLPGRIDGGLTDVIVQVEVCTLQDENIKLWVDRIDRKEIKSVDQENMDIERKIWEAIHIRCQCPTLGLNLIFTSQGKLSWISNTFWWINQYCWTRQLVSLNSLTANKPELSVLILYLQRKLPLCQDVPLQRKHLKSNWTPKRVK